MDVGKDILNEKQSAYGKKILPTLSAELEFQLSGGFSTRNLMMIEIEFPFIYELER